VVSRDIIHELTSSFRGEEPVSTKLSKAIVEKTEAIHLGNYEELQDYLLK